MDGLIIIEYRVQVLLPNVVCVEYFNLTEYFQQLLFVSVLVLYTVLCMCYTFIIHVMFYRLLHHYKTENSVVVKLVRLSALL